MSLFRRLFCVGAGEVVDNDREWVTTHSSIMQNEVCYTFGPLMIGGELVVEETVPMSFRKQFPFASHCLSNSGLLCFQCS